MLGLQRVNVNTDFLGPNLMQPCLKTSTIMLYQGYAVLDFSWLNPFCT